MRNTPPHLARMIGERAQADRASLNKTVIHLLEEDVGGPTKARDRVYRDLDHLAGSWTKREEDAFDRNLACLRKIDTELWR